MVYGFGGDNIEIDINHSHTSEEGVTNENACHVSSRGNEAKFELSYNRISKFMNESKSSTLDPSGFIRDSEDRFFLIGVHEGSHIHQAYKDDFEDKRSRHNLVHMVAHKYPLSMLSEKVDELRDTRRALTIDTMLGEGNELLKLAGSKKVTPIIKSLFTKHFGNDWEKDCLKDAREVDTFSVCMEAIDLLKLPSRNVMSEFSKNPAKMAKQILSV